jgi:ABC-type multidrug transport system permease subunit
MARSAVVSGRVAADVVYNAGILAVLMITGLAVGWRVTTGVADFLLAVVLLLGFTFAMTWVGVYMGMSVSTVEVVQQVGFITIFPLSFVSNAFVPLASLPGWLQPFAEWNPFSALVQASRVLFGNPVVVVADSWPSQHPILLSLLWVAAITLVFAPLGVRKYATSSR